jgi:hypothetical protein
MYVISAGGARESTRCRRREALADTRIIYPPIGERYGSFSRAMSMSLASSPRVRGRVGFLLGDEERRFLLGARPGRWPWSRCARGCIAASEPSRPGWRVD